jgi:hypothetical protein
MAEITGIYIAAGAGQPMHPVASAQLESGKGIVGDRYHTGRGAFSKKLAASGKDDWQITLIESEEIESSSQCHYGRHPSQSARWQNILAGWRAFAGGQIMRAVQLPGKVAWQEGIACNGRSLRPQSAHSG